MNTRQISEYIRRTAEAVQLFVDMELAKCNDQPKEGSNLDQLGLRDGKSIVEDFLNHNEPGLALEHLVYMIEETDMVLSEEVRTQIKMIAQAMHMNISL